MLFSKTFSSVLKFLTVASLVAFEGWELDFETGTSEVEDLDSCSKLEFAALRVGAALNSLDAGNGGSSESQNI